MVNWTEREINWEGDSWTLHCDMAEVKTIIDDQINNVYYILYNS